MIDTGTLATRIRSRIIRPDTREILIARLQGSEQEMDLTDPPNCGGYGRIRHFRRQAGDGWADNPLPMDPACKALGMPVRDVLVAQVFQSAGCAWRCWYCYVPFNLLSGDERRGAWLTAEALVRLHQAEPDAPCVIDLSGGSPDLSPEWVIWMMDALEAAGLSQRTYLWSDDNLSTDYVFTRLAVNERARLSEYANYGRVCCFKGFDARSFSFNTGAEPEGYERQFQLFERYVRLGIDLYGYVTLTGPDPSVAQRGVVDLMDRLQEIAPALPLRVVPLRIAPFGPMLVRTDPVGRQAAMAVQDLAMRAWRREIELRFPGKLSLEAITEVQLIPS